MSGSNTFLLPPDEERALKERFARRFGAETLEAEQELSATQPFHLDNWLQRLLRSRSVGFRPNGDLEKEYQSAAGRVFRIPTILVPVESARRHSLSPAGLGADESIFFETIAGQRYLRWFTHPAAYALLKESHPNGPSDPRRWFGTPSSSHRSLFAAEEGAPEGSELILKLSLPRRTMGFGRMITEQQVARSVFKTAFVHDAWEKTAGKLPGGGRWCMMPEIFAFTPDERTDGGYIARRMPSTFNPDRQVLLPYYALIASRASGKWFERLFAASGERDPEVFLWNRLVQPLLELYQVLSLDFGMSTELHQQNVGIVVDKLTLTIDSLYLRDLDVVAVDVPYRRHLSLKDPISTPEWAHHIRDIPGTDDAQLWQSFNFYFMCGMNVDQLAKAILPKRIAHRFIQRAHHFHLTVVNAKLGVRLRTIGSLSRAWDKFHRRITPRQDYDRVPRKKRWICIGYGYIRQFEIFLFQFLPLPKPKRASGFRAWLSDKLKEGVTRDQWNHIKFGFFVLFTAKSRKKIAVPLGKLRAIHILEHETARLKMRERATALQSSRPQILESGKVDTASLKEVMPSPSAMMGVLASDGLYYLFNGNSRLHALNEVFPDSSHLLIEIECFELRSHKTLQWLHRIRHSYTSPTTKELD